MQVSAWLIFFVGVVLGAILGAIGICVIALVWKGDEDGRNKNIDKKKDGV